MSKQSFLTTGTYLFNKWSIIFFLKLLILNFGETNPHVLLILLRLRLWRLLHNPFF